MSGAVVITVLEIGCPAEHSTFPDHVTTLPDCAEPDPTLVFGGQRFVHHTAGCRPDDALDEACHQEWEDTQIGEATDGLASVRVGRWAGAAGRSEALTHDAEFALVYVLRGQCELHVADDPLPGGGTRCYVLETDDSFVVPAGTEHHLVQVAACYVVLPTCHRTRVSSVRVDVNSVLLPVF